MADNTFEILIKYGLDATKAKEAASELTKIREETRKASSDVEAYNQRLKEMAQLQEANRMAGGEMEDTYKALRKSVDEANVASQQEQTEVSKKFFAYKDLKSAVKGLKEEFPALAHGVRLALNPVALTVAAITGAFVLWKTKVEQLSQSLGGIEMPGLGEGDLERITKYGAVWEGIAKNMAAAANKSETIRRDFELSVKIVEGSDKVAKAFGLDTGTGAAEDKRGLALAAADTLEANARARIARAGSPGSAASEANVQSAFDKAVEKAIADKGETQGRIDWLLGMKDSGLLKQMVSSPKFVTRYGYPAGFFGSVGENIEGALNMERSNLASQQAVIDAGGRFAINRVSRGVRRGEISAAGADLDAAAGMRSQAAGLGQEIATGSASLAGQFASSASDKLATGNLRDLIHGVVELAIGTQEWVRAQKQLDQANKELRSLVNQNSQRQ